MYFDVYALIQAEPTDILIFDRCRNTIGIIL